MSEKVVGVDMGTGPSWAVRVTMEDGKVVGIKRRMELIQWPRAKYWTKAWNPVVGCKPVSPACENCYAKAWAKRFGQSFFPHQSKNQNPPKKGVVFCGNVTDLFGSWVDTKESIGFVRKTLECPNATFLYLTKRPGNMAWDLDEAWVFPEHYNLKSRITAEMAKNHYFGFTAENDEWFHKRYLASLRVPVMFKTWVSAEPLLGPISISIGRRGGVAFDWVVVGCESGPHRRPCKVEWVESIVEQCMNAKIPVFVKQLDLNGRCETDINNFPAHLRIRQVPWKKEEA